MAISVKASCNRFIGEDEVRTTLDIEKLWQPVADSIGPIVQDATDGDKRRGAAYRSLTNCLVTVPGFRFLEIRVLHDGATVTKDLHHILKRFVRLLFSANPRSIYGTAIDTIVLLLLANALRTASRPNTAFKEEEFMLVPNALTIIDGMTEIACGDFAD